MKAFLQSRITKIAIGVLAGVGLFAGGVAVAGHNANHKTFIGGGLVSSKVSTDGAGWGPPSAGAWHTVTGTSQTVSVPSGSVRLVTSRFNAESSCAADSWCAVRVVARKSGSSTVYEMYPRVGTEFAFDSPSGEAWEGNSVHRTLRLGSSGTWYISVQAYVVNTGSMYLDDWHFETSVQTTS